MTAAETLRRKATTSYLSPGAFDGQLDFEAPDDETATAVLLRLGAAGNVRTTTARAFTASEMDAILAK